MRKFLASVCTALILVVMPTVVSAERDVNKSPDYNFKAVRQTELGEITFNTGYDARNYQEDFGAQTKVEQQLRAALNDKGIKVSARTAPIAIKVSIDALGTYQEYVAPYDETKTVDKKTVGRDEHGRDVIVTIPTEEVVHHEAREVTHAVVILNFTVIDNKTGNIIYTATDSRERSSENDTSGMLKRICKEFAKEISRN